jgi:hypothetical protein
MEENLHATARSLQGKCAAIRPSQMTHTWIFSFHLPGAQLEIIVNGRMAGS